MLPFFLLYGHDPNYDSAFPKTECMYLQNVLYTADPHCVINVTADENLIAQVVLALNFIGFWGVWLVSSCWL